MISKTISINLYLSMQDTHIFLEKRQLVWMARAFGPDAGCGEDEFLDAASFALLFPLAQRQVLDGV
jgi:hypothetical protein